MIDVKHFESGMIKILVHPDSKPEFLELVQRATNLWPDASPDIKEFADLVTNEGKLMQDYRQPTVTQQPKFCSTLLTTCRLVAKVRVAK
jgi:hypothetical protein